MRSWILASGLVVANMNLSDEAVAPDHEQVRQRLLALMTRLREEPDTVCKPTKERQSAAVEMARPAR